MTPEPRACGAESNPAACYARPAWQHRCHYKHHHMEPLGRTGPALLFPGLAGGAAWGAATCRCWLLRASFPDRRQRSTASSLQTHSGRRWCEHSRARSSRGSQLGASRGRRSGSAERPVPGEAALSRGAAGSRRKGTAGEEALPVSGDIYHLSLSCRSSCSSLSPLLLRATCPRIQVTTSRRARCVRGERLLQQQGQSLPDSAAGTVLPLPAPSPAPTWPHSGPQPL